MTQEQGDQNHRAIITLRDYVDTLFREHEKREAIWRDDTEKALAVSAGEIERRMSDINHWKAETLRERGEYATRELVEDRHRQMMAWRDLVNDKLSQSSGGLIAWAAAIAFAFLVVNAVILWVTRN